MISVTDETFDQEINDNIPVIVKFGAPWCGPCSAIQLILEELSGEYEGKAKFIGVNTDETSIATRFNIRSIPTVLIFRNGQVVNTIVGAQTKGRMQLAIGAALA